MQDLKMEDLLEMRRAYMSDRQRLENGLPIRRPRRKQQLQNDCRLRTCVAKYDNGEIGYIDQTLKLQLKIKRTQFTLEAGNRW